MPQPVSTPQQPSGRINWFKAMGIDGISASQVSSMAAELDAKVAEGRQRPSTLAPTATCGSMR